MRKIRLFSILAATVFSVQLNAQTNVFDDVIAASPNHNYLEAALLQEGLSGALQNPGASLTVFAPDDQAFEQLANALQTDIAGLLALDNLSDILLYHVLGTAVPSTAVTNGAIVEPLSNSNTLKLTLTGSGNVFVNHAQVETPDLTTDNGIVHSINAVLLPVQTVVDVALDNGFTTLATAVITAELLPALSNPLATLTVFAPTNEAFTALAGALGTDINGLLALPNLADVLTYHVLGTEVPSSAVTNGAIVQPLSTSNTLKLTVTSTGSVFVNQAQVTLADVTADNGVVHVINEVVLPAQTVVDVAINNGFSYLATAVVTAELLPALSEPLATYTVFAPTNAAFDNLAGALGTDINGLLALPNLADVLTYHVLGTEVPSSAVTNGAIVQPLSPSNTLKLTVTSTGSVFVNQAQVTLADVAADNGVVHVIDAVVLPVETVVDVAIDNGFSTLVTAVVQEELVPVLINPLASLTVFAPTNEAFQNLADQLSTDINGLLALPNLTEVLTYHVLGTEVFSTELTAGPVNTLNGSPVTVSLTNGVMINNANVTLADVLAYNGVVHVIDAVLLPIDTQIDQFSNEQVTLFPNPVQDVLTINGEVLNYSIMDQQGRLIQKGGLMSNKTIDFGVMESGIYFVQLQTASGMSNHKVIKN
jgi:transforming growth factor-beta-induced protein